MVCGASGSVIVVKELKTLYFCNYNKKRKYISLDRKVIGGNTRQRVAEVRQEWSRMRGLLQ